MSIVFSRVFAPSPAPYETLTYERVGARLVTISGAAGRAFSTGIDLKDLAVGKIDNS